MWGTQQGKLVCCSVQVWGSNLRQGGGGKGSKTAECDTIGGAGDDWTAAYLAQRINTHHTAVAYALLPVRHSVPWYARGLQQNVRGG